MKRVVLVCCVILIAAGLAHAGREMCYPKDDSPHYLYLPETIDPDTTYWVVVGVHGAGGRNKGANGMAGWVDKKDDVIVLGPKFSNTYQNANPPDQELLIGLFKKLQKEYKVHPKMFLYGFSGGSQFAHRFVMKQPDYVCGVSSHSGGSWGTDTYGKMNPKAKHIPFAISCGGKDTGKAWGEAPYNRLEWYERFEKAMAKDEFFYRGAIWTNVGHSASAGVREMTEECFQLATKGILPGSELEKRLDEAAQLAATGKFDEANRLKHKLVTDGARLPENSGWNDSKEAFAIRAELVQNALAQVDTSPAERRRFSLYTQCVEAIKTGKNLDDRALLGFMGQCPPSYWLGKPESERVRDACNTAAESHLSMLREQKRLNMRTYQTLLRQWDGLKAGADLLEEYDAAAQKHLDQVLSMKDGLSKQRALQSFISRWQVGACVAKAKAALDG